MLIHNGFELTQKTILFVSAQLHLKQYKKFTVASHGFLKRNHRRYSGLVPNYTSTRTSYSVVAPLRGYFSIHDSTFVCQEISVVTRTLFKQKIIRGIDQLNTSNYLKLRIRYNKRFSQFIKYRIFQFGF